MSERHVTFDMILTAVSAVTGFGVNEIRSDRRSRDLAYARFAAWWLATKLTDLSLPTIGRLCGDRDTGTVGHGVKQAEELRQQDPEFRLELDTVLASLRALEAAGIIRLAETIDPIVTARRVLAAPAREAVRVSTYEIIAMSQLIVALHGPNDDPTPELELNHAD